MVGANRLIASLPEVITKSGSVMAPRTTSRIPSHRRQQEISGSKGDEAVSTVGRVERSRQKAAKLTISLFETALAWIPMEAKAPNADRGKAASPTVFQASIRYIYC